MIQTRAETTPGRSGNSSIWLLRGQTAFFLLVWQNNLTSDSFSGHSSYRTKPNHLTMHSQALVVTQYSCVYQNVALNLQKIRSERHAKKDSRAQVTVNATPAALAIFSANLPLAWLQTNFISKPIFANSGYLFFRYFLLHWRLKALH